MARSMLGIIDALIEEHLYQMHIYLTTIQCKYHLWEFDIEKKCAVENTKIKINTFHIKINKRRYLFNLNKKIK